MIISRTPLRISFLGGGTDYEAWFREHGGACVSAAIDKYCYISVRRLPPFFAHKYRVVYSRVEVANEISEVEHPAARAVLQWAGLPEGLEIHHDADLPARAGLGTGSAYTTGLLKAMEAYRGRVTSKGDLARTAIHLEQEVMREPVGWQDQICAAYGGFNLITLSKEGRFEVERLKISGERLAEFHGHLLLFFTGVVRDSMDIARSKVEGMAQRQTQLQRTLELALDGAEVLRNPARDLREFGGVLHESWMMKRELAPRVTNDTIDAMYEAGRKAGALGGKLMGAGGGGFMLFFAEPEKHASIQQAMEGHFQVPFQFESGGSRIALYQPEGL